jgi:hypothetical protein
MAYMVAMFVNRLGQNEQCEKDDVHLVMANYNLCENVVDRLNR